MSRALAISTMLLFSVDPLLYLPLDPERCPAFLRQGNPRLGIFPQSAMRGEGLSARCNWLREQARTYHGR
jgi:hypothetical protein